jgi:hypothetical protein
MLGCIHVLRSHTLRLQDCGGDRCHQDLAFESSSMPHPGRVVLYCAQRQAS